ncbi:hypothetical protein XFF6992_370118 [Xanthomonas citri pv. fuscans]|nr:hypothetical protein XFF6992_370118 [Xanthomonas citri pv. fuscans]SOO33843.1 hypothetical protein XFF6994_3240001 [Xanthomonas citri pv. fuscans]
MSQHVRRKLCQNRDSARCSARRHHPRPSLTRCGAAHQRAGMPFAQVSPDVSYVRIATAVTAPALRDVSTDWLFKREG